MRQTMLSIQTELFIYTELINCNNMNKTTLPVTKSTVIEFANATINNDLMKIKDLLCDSGDYQIQTKNLVIRKANKKSFLKWFINKLSETQVINVDYDQCLHCYIGNSVLLFNNGEFPIIIKDSSFRTKMGLMLDVQNSNINRIKFCALFLKKENPYVFEKRIKDSIDREDSFPF